MKNSRNILLFVLFISMSSFAQSLEKEVQHPDIAGKLFHNPKATKEKIIGSPYYQQIFAKAKVVNIKVDAYMRYNIYADEFEFITPKNDTLILDKIEDFGTIHFTGLNRKYNLLAYTEGKKLVYGYLLNVYVKNDFALFKKENVSLTAAKVAKTTLEISMPARYTKSGDSFFLKNREAGIIEFPNSKKALLKVFPDKKEAIETYFKENKIDFDAEADLIKVINLLAQIITS